MNVYIYTHNSCLESSKVNLAILTHSDPFTGPKLYKTYLWNILSKPPFFFLLPESPLQVIPFIFLQSSGGGKTARNTGGRQPGSYDGAFDLSALGQFKSCWKCKVAGGGGSEQKLTARWFKVTFLGWLSYPFKWLSDLQLEDEKVTLNHLVVVGCWYTVVKVDGATPFKVAICKGPW